MSAIGVSARDEETDRGLTWCETRQRELGAAGSKLGELRDEVEGLKLEKYKLERECERRLEDQQRSLLADIKVYIMTWLCIVSL
jgi:hypothetical protein